MMAIITVNTRKVETAAAELSYADVVEIAYEDRPKMIAWSKLPGAVITIVYQHGHCPKQDGCLAPSESVRVKDGMIFSLAITGSA
jgi:hypothetical protein